ncbi:MAG: S1/P1 nuclease [Rubripirellula sp.]
MMGNRSITVKHSFGCFKILAGCLLLVLAFCSVGNAFWEQGHHVIAVMAYEQLEPDEQAELIRILKHHPRFEQDFTIPESIKGDQEAIHRWWIGQAGYWPDLIRGNEKYDRPTWHYQVGATLVIGDVDLPDDPGPLPEDATLETRELYIVQAIELCKKVFHDKTQADADRAIALCWLAHLVADAHQPCHAGSLYSPIAFPDGDRGANGIPIRGQGNIRNLHAFWDSLLGDKATPESVGKRASDLRSRFEHLHIKDGKNANWSGELTGTLPSRNQSSDLKKLDLQSKEPADWIRNGRILSRNSVYTQDVGDAVALMERGLVEQLSPIELEEVYQRLAIESIHSVTVAAVHKLTEIVGSM